MSNWIGTKNISVLMNGVPSASVFANGLNVVPIILTFTMITDDNGHIQEAPDLDRIGFILDGSNGIEVPCMPELPSADTPQSSPNNPWCYTPIPNQDSSWKPMFGVGPVPYSNVPEDNTVSYGFYFWCNPTGSRNVLQVGVRLNDGPNGAPSYYNTNGTTTGGTWQPKVVLAKTTQFQRLPPVNYSVNDPETVDCQNTNPNGNSAQLSGYRQHVTDMVANYIRFKGTVNSPDPYIAHSQFISEAVLFDSNVIIKNLNIPHRTGEPGSIYLCSNGQRVTKLDDYSAASFFVFAPGQDHGGAAESYTSINSDDPFYCSNTQTFTLPRDKYHFYYGQSWQSLNNGYYLDSFDAGDLIVKLWDRYGNSCTVRISAAPNKYGMTLTLVDHN